MECLPPSGPCSCHECQGIHCLVWHPGHSHRDSIRAVDWFEIAVAESRRLQREEQMADNLREVADA